jgi:hypothetical protein
MKMLAVLFLLMVPALITLSQQTDPVRSLSQVVRIAILKFHSNKVNDVEVLLISITYNLLK